MGGVTADAGPVVARKSGAGTTGLDTAAGGLLDQRDGASRTGSAGRDQQDGASGTAAYSTSDAA